MTTKTFDSVKLMRELRDQISQEMEPLTAGERIRYIQAKAASTSLGRTLAEPDVEAATEADPVGGASVGH